MSGDKETDVIRKAFGTFYTLEELNRAKDILWKVGDTSAYPPLFEACRYTK